METLPENTDDRLARLEGQYHALSKQLTDNFKEVRDTLDQVKNDLEGLTQVKSGMLKSESLTDVLKRLDERTDEMQKQIQSISNAVQIK